MLAPMVSVTGVEMVLGLVRDEQFGPLVMLGFGGVNVETIRDVAYALPPFDRATARRLVDSLRLRPLLDGLRDRPAGRRRRLLRRRPNDSRCWPPRWATSSMKSTSTRSSCIRSGCIAVDALVVGSRRRSRSGIVDRSPEHLLKHSAR